MKILFTGGGSGRHFYPIIAIIQELRKVISEEKLIDPQIYFMSDKPYNKKVLFDNEVIFKSAPAGKIRTYFSFRNFTDLIKTGVGVLKAVFSIYFLFPDIVVSKGGYASFPALLAARIFGIPVLIHESDSVPGKTNAWAGKFAKSIAVSYEDAVKFFPKDKVVFTGQPVRQEIQTPIEHGAYEYLNLSKDIPTIFIIGGSLGARIINDTVLDALPQLIGEFQIIHQTGKDNLVEVNNRASILLENNPNASRYKTFGYLNDLAIQMSSGVSQLVLSRAGSTIFEIASWGIPSIIVPITESNGNHQRENAFNYARSGACIVMEEKNFSPNLLYSEIKRLMDDKKIRSDMGKAAKSFASPKAGHKIAKQVIEIALEHEK